MVQRKRTVNMWQTKEKLDLLVIPSASQCPDRLQFLTFLSSLILAGKWSKNKRRQTMQSWGGRDNHNDGFRPVEGFESNNVMKPREYTELSCTYSQIHSLGEWRHYKHGGLGTKQGKSGLCLLVDPVCHSSGHRSDNHPGLFSNSQELYEWTTAKTDSDLITQCLLLFERKDGLFLKQCRFLLFCL